MGDYLADQIRFCSDQLKTLKEENKVQVVFAAMKYSY